MKTINVLFHLFVIAWYGYFVSTQMESVIEGSLAGKDFTYFIFRTVVAIVFLISFLEIIRKKERGAKNCGSETKKSEHN